MPKYMIRASYTAQGARGLLKDGGTRRKQVIEQLVAGLSGTLEALYFAFGDRDVVMILDLPSDEAATAAALTAAATGAANPTTTVLLTPEQIDAAVKTAVSYAPPGE